MTKKLFLSYFLLFFFSVLSFAQINNKFWIKGKVIDSSSVVKDVHVVNLTNEKGTFTNDFGDYKIVVSIGDTLQFTSVRHQTVKRVISKFNYSSEILDVFLPVKTVELEEFDLKTHDLSGFLSADVKKTPIDRRAEALKRTMDFSNVDMSVRRDDDYIDTRVKPPVVVVDPTKKFKGIGGFLGIGHKNKKEKRLRKFVSNRFTSKSIYDLYGEDFFKTLKIPKGEVFNFIDYCKQFNIQELYKKNLTLDLVAVLKREAPNFLEQLKP
jgi:hypothetical protein